MRRFILRVGVMFLTFTFGLAGNFLVNGLGLLVEQWIETPEPVLEESYANALAAQMEISPFVLNCGLIVIRVGDDRSLWLRNEWMGNLDNPSTLLARLNEIFKGRLEGRVYRSGFELNSDIPAADRLEKTVLIEVPRWISYGEVSDLIDEIRAAGGKPIGLTGACLFVSNRID